MSNNKNFKVKNSIDLGAYNKSIDDTAVDVFVYDTSKDSDGGAWRKRTQHTSWYNETLNTSTRGSRKEFPAVAVIVAENGTVTIYDGDDPDLPMWMVFNSDSWTGGVPTRASTSGNTTAVCMLNGYFCITSGGTTASGLSTANFVSDVTEFISGTGFNYTFNKGVVSQRNIVVTPSATSGLPSYALVDSECNDVAMTVLPNAPIDAATGLPVPTIAVATDGGVSVIKDDGTVVDSTSTSAKQSVAFEGSVLLFSNPSNGSTWVADNYNADNFATSTTYNNSGTSQVTVNADDINDAVVRGLASDQGLNLLDTNFTARGRSSAAFITSDYNTGWMNGDIKLATLSDTDDTNVTGSELVTNGTFDSDSDWTKGTGWTISGGGLVATSANSSTYQSLSSVLTIGNTYVAEFDITSYTSGGVVLQIDGATFSSVASAVGSYSATFQYQGISSLLRVANSTNSTLTVDNVSVRLAEEDRSVNGNGLQVFGTVTKSAVATGADLVAYSGFAYGSGNYLKQPYNSDLDFGTGDFCFMGWANITTTSGDSTMLASVEYSNEDTPDDGDWLYRGDGGSTNIRFYIRASGAWNYVQASSAIALNTWQHHCVVRQNGITTIYVNGVPFVSSDTLSGKAFNSKATGVTVGSRFSYPDEDTKGSLSLWRISATAPSPEQIKYIYESEKPLFQEGAQATLYGDSDAVTALAYDDSTELLHVGTSAGRSVFQGLRRVDNTEDAVGAAISASNNLIVEE